MVDRCSKYKKGLTMWVEGQNIGEESAKFTFSAFFIYGVF